MKLTRAWFINLYLICLITPLCLKVKPFLLILPIISLIIFIRERKAYTSNALWLSVVFFGILFFGVFLSTEDIPERIWSMHTQLPFLILPLSFMVIPPRLIAKKLNLLLFTYVLGAVINSLYSIGHSFYCVLFLGEFDVISIETLDFYFSQIQHHTYFSLHSIIAMTFIIRLFFGKFKNRKMKFFLLFAWVVINIAVYIATSRAGLILALLINLYLFWRIVPLIKFRWIRYSLPFVLLGMLALVTLRNDKLTYIFEEENGVMVNFWNKGGNGTRDVIWSAALEEGWERFPIGQGTNRSGTVMKESHLAEYEENEVARTPNAHNQYLEIYVDNGIPGLMVFFLILYLLFREGIQYRQKLVLAFLGIFTFMFLITSVFKHPYGAPPFALFYSVFMVYASSRGLQPKSRHILARLTTVSVSMNVLLKGQLGYLNEKFKVLGITSPGKEVREIEEREGVTIHTVRMNRSFSPLRDLLALIHMTILLFWKRPDIVHSQTPKAGLIGILGSRLAGVKYRIHSVVGLPLQEQKGLKRVLVSWADKLVYANSTHVLINSKGLKAYMLENNIISEKKIEVLGNGTTNGINLDFYKDTSAIRQQGQEVKKELFGDQNMVCFLFVGRIVKDKGINELVEAFNRLSKASQNIRLILVGRTESKDQVSRETMELIQRNDDIIPVGYQKDIRPYLSLADYFVFPSYREGFPNVILQALAFNLPCIATDINGANEVIENGKNGVLVPVKDQEALYKTMNEMVINEGLKNQIDNRPMLSEKYDQHFLWNQYLKFYQNL